MLSFSKRDASWKDASLRMITKAFLSGIYKEILCAIMRMVIRVVNK